MADLPIFRPPAFFRLFSDIGVLDPSIKNVVTFGNLRAGEGGARYTRITGTAPLTNRAYKPLGDGTYLALDRDQSIHLTMFGGMAEGDALDSGLSGAALTARVANNTTAVSNADAWAKAVIDGYYTPIIMPIGRLRYAYEATISRGLNWQSASVIGASDSSNSSELNNGATNIFTPSTGTVRDYYVFGIMFAGNSNNFHLITTASGSTNKLQWGKFAFVGLTGFDRAISVLGTGVTFFSCFFQNNTVSAELAGSDHYFQDNFIDANAGQPFGFTITLGIAGVGAGPSGGCQLTSCRGNFITGRHQIPMRLGTGVGSCNTEGCRVFDNEFDISDTCGCYIDRSRDAHVFANTYNRLGQVVNATYNAQLQINDSFNIVHENNTFMMSADTQVANFPTHKLVSSSLSACHDIFLDDVVYTDGMVRRFSIDANSDHPIVGERYPMPPIVVTTGDITWKPNSSRAIITEAATPLGATRTVTLATQGGKAGLVLPIVKGDTGSALVIKQGATTLKTIPAGAVASATAVLAASGNWAVG